ncbi:MAG: hypothetical protein JWM34_2740 [Ilumatobacteraceae bacterium]|nr:hypothetical protein [Ilumatobacteraceae bacterium]
MDRKPACMVARMRRRLMVGLAASGALLMGACGDRSAVAPQAVSASDVASSVATPTPGTDAAPVSDTAVPSTPVPTDPGYSSDVTAVPSPPGTVVDTVLDTVAVDPANTLDVPSVGASSPDDAIASANAVTADDPVPLEVDAAADPVAAETAIRFAFQHWILLDLDKNVRASLMENGEANVDHIDQEMHSLSGLLGCARVAVDGVEPSDPSHAVVQFRMLCGQVVSSYFPSAIVGGAVFADGSWRIDRGTICYLAFATGADCAGNLIDTPTPATTFTLSPVPDGFSLSDYTDDAIAPPGEGPVMVTTVTVPAGGLPIPGDSTWGKAGDANVGFSISTEVMKGVSELTDDDMARVLAASHFGAPNGEPVTIGGRPGRIEDDGVTVALVFVRADDVLVQVRGYQVSTDVVLAAATAIH